MKIILPLAAALVVSVALNVALLRRDPPRAKATPDRTPPAPEAAAPSSPVPAPPAATAPGEAPLREEIRSLKTRLAVAEASVELNRTRGTSAPPEQPDARDFERLKELVDALIEWVPAQAFRETGEPITVQKQIVTPRNREQALGLLEDYASLDPKLRPTFRERALAAIERLRRVQEESAEEALTVAPEVERLQKLGRNEEAQACADRASQRSAQREDEWVRDHVGPLRAMLDLQDGVRAALLSRRLSDLLTTIGSPDER